MSIFLRDYHREAMQPKGSKGEWYSVTLASLVCLHVYTEDGQEWKTRITGAATFDRKGFQSREQAEESVLVSVRQRLEAALSDTFGDDNGA